jgi:predicted acyl esterase
MARVAPRRATRLRAFLGWALVAAGMLATVPPAAGATVEQHGYLTVRDGTRLRYDVVRPDGPGPFPALLNYEGYAAGSNASDNGVAPTPIGC